MGAAVPLTCRRAPVLPLAVGAAAAAMLAASVTLWVTAAGPAGIATTPVELAPTLSLVGAVLLWRRPGNRIAALIAGTGLLFGVATLSAATLDHAAGAAGGGLAADLALAGCWLAAALPVPWMLLVLWFPDGRFTAPGWRRAFLAGAVAAVVIATAGYLFAPPGRVPSIASGGRVPAGLGGPFSAASSGYLLSLTDLMTLLPLIALPALIIRYRRADAGVVRQQIRWLFIAAAATIAGTLAASALAQGPPAAATLGTVLAAVVQPLPALGIAIAVLRYRLFDIDVLVSRAAVYATLWAGLSVLLLVPALASGYLVGGPGALTAVGAALVVTLAFQPVRRRVQDGVEARLYDARRRGLQQLAQVGEALRRAVDMDDVGPRVAVAVAEALQVPWAAVWVYVRAGDAGALRPVGLSGIDGVPVRVSADVAATLHSRPFPSTGPDVTAELCELLPAAPGAVVPLVAGAELVGLLACGQRAREPLEARDLEPLARFAGECALGLRGMRLDAELRARLSEIEAQTAELRSSRQRLVRAQDDERRRIERDLHDGVQQQLVGLAARLRRLALASEPAVRADCERLAAEAEDTVFAMQDLARGIFPAVLSDQGLVAALRAHAGRSPLPVRVEIEPSIGARRFDPQIEAALYFVALEALTNVAKHAPNAAVSVALRTESPDRRLVLEVHDDGPGLPPRRDRRNGTGLANIRDRVSAVGGNLHLDSRPGAGTWVRAGVPLDAEVVALHRADVDSRR